MNCRKSNSYTYTHKERNTLSNDFLRFTPLEILNLFRNLFLTGFKFALGIELQGAFFRNRPKRFSEINAERCAWVFCFSGLFPTDFKSGGGKC